MKKNLPLYLLTGLFLLVYAAVFDSKIDLGGDNAGYYILGKALSTGADTKPDTSPPSLAISRTRVLLMCCTFALVCKNTVSTSGAK